MKVRNGVMMVYIEIIYNLKFTYKKKKKLKCILLYRKNV